MFQVNPEETARCVSDAISVGYRLIDTAQAYYNEEGVSEGIARSGVNRSDLFLTTKVWITNAGEEKVAASIDESLRKLRTDYIDLLLIHQPFNDYYGSYRAMERALKAGKVRAIGVSNFYHDRLVDIAENMDVKPAVVQLHTNVFRQQWDAEAEAKKYGTKIMAWGPIAQGRKDLYTNPLLLQMAEKHGKTVAQVALRYLTQRGIIAIPKSSHKDCMAENINIFDFTLTREEMESIRPLDEPLALEWSHRDPELVRFLLNYDKNNRPK